MQEELRLAHVAVTRARNNLFITSHRVNEGSLHPPITDTEIHKRKHGVGKRPFVDVFEPSTVPLPDGEASALTRIVHGDELETKVVSNFGSDWVKRKWLHLYHGGQDPGALQVFY